MRDYDFIVAGAGTAGSLAAKVAAKAGLKVCLLDRKEKSSIGMKICGDAIGRHHFITLRLGDPHPEEIECVMEGIEVHSPDRQTNYVVKGEQLYGYILDRHRFGQRLVKEAVDAGAHLLDKVQVLDPILKDGYVCGVSVKNLRTGEEVEYSAPLVADATGFFASIRKKLAPEIKIENYVDNRDVEACYREIRHLKQPLANPNLCQIYLNQSITPGGYYWIFPEGKDKVNVGLGVAMVEGFPNPKEQLYNHVIPQQLFDESTVVNGGAWFVPTRRPLDSMVGNGIIIVGDAACQVNPIHGGGIGPSMIGGSLAAETAMKALEKNDVSRRSLWSYNSSYIGKYGGKQAGLEVFRILLQHTNDEDLNYGMRYRLLTEEDLLKTSMGDEIQFTISEKARRVFRGIKKLSFLRKLRNAAHIMKEIRIWYKNYPTSPDDFEGWRSGTKKLFQKATNEFKNQ
jgi:digeranylgeranylglycerophospholipid reductase